MTYKEIGKRINAVVEEIEKVVVGKREALRQIMTAILANGHILLEE